MTEQQECETCEGVGLVEQMGPAGVPHVIRCPSCERPRGESLTEAIHKASTDALVTANSQNTAIYEQGSRAAEAVLITVINHLRREAESRENTSRSHAYTEAADHLEASLRGSRE